MKAAATTQSCVRVLHLEDDENDHLLVKEMLASEGLPCKFQLARSRAEFEVALQRDKFDLIVSDYTLPSYDGLKALTVARQTQPKVPFIFFSGTIGEENAIESLKTGATDYVLKQRPQRLLPAVHRALQEAVDRTRRELIEEKMRQQAALLDQAGDAIMVRDQEGRIVYWNKGAERVYGWKSEEALGQHADQLLINEDPVQLEIAKKEVLITGEWASRVHQTTKDDRAIIVESRWTLVRDREGNPHSILVINTDMSDVVKLEARLLRAQRMESIGALAGGIAHDLNNILTPILMATDLLAQNMEDPENKQLLETTHSCARRGAELVKQILSFTRGISGKPELLQIKPLVTEMASLARDTFPRSIRIETNIAEGLPLVLGNPTQLHQVLMNLCVNARDAMPDGGILQLAADRTVLDKKVFPASPVAVSGDHLVLSVTDTGHGMSQEILCRLFEAYYTTKAEGKGTGLGLSTALEIAKNHGGHIDVVSVVGKGSTFSVYLPCSPIPTVRAAEPVKTPSPLGNGEGILVVDDELAVMEMTKQTLESFNYRVFAATNGIDAVALFKRCSGEIRAVITDMMMPGMDGPEMIQALQKIAPDVAVIGISGLGSGETHERARELMARAFLRKPFTTDDLLRTLRGVLDSKGRPV